MKKVTVRLSLCAMLFALCGSVEAQQPKKVPRIGYLSTRDPTNESSRSEAVWLGLRALGYVEGQNIAIEYRYSEGRRERFAELAAELVQHNVDVIVIAGGDPAVQSVMNATKTIPIVMTGGGADPVEAGFVKSLSRPDGNVTGITLLVIDLAGKRLELLKEAVPKVSRVAVLYESDNPTSVIEANEVLPAAARTLKMTTQPWEVRTQGGFEKVFAGLKKHGADGLYVSTGALMNTNQKRIAGFASKSQLPAMYGRKEYVENGGLMYYGADLADSYKRVAYYVDRILKGAKPTDLPVEQPTKFEFVINLKTATQLGLTIPQSVLYRADKVIK